MPLLSELVVIGRELDRAALEAGFRSGRAGVPAAPESREGRLPGS